MTGRERNHYERLVRMRDWRAHRLANYQGRDPGHLAAEVAALQWAIQLVRHAEEHGILSDLAAVTR